MGFKNHGEELKIIDIEDMELLVNLRLEEANDFFDSLETELLNEFAMNRETVICSMAKLMIFSGKYDHHMYTLSRNSIAFSVINPRLEHLLETHQPQEMSSKEHQDLVFSQAVFWLSFHSDYDYQKAVAKAKDGGQFNTVDIEKLEKIYNYPHALAYFLMDIWDIDIVTKYIENNVDPHLAKSSNRESQNDI